MTTANHLEDGGLHARWLVFQHCRRLRRTWDSWPTVTGAPRGRSGTMLAWLFSGLFQRFPSLRLPFRRARSADSLLPPACGSRYSTSNGIGRCGPNSSATMPTSDVDFDKLDIRGSFEMTSSGASSRIITAFGRLARDRRGQTLMCEMDYPHSYSLPHRIGTGMVVIKDLSPEIRKASPRQR